MRSVVDEFRWSRRRAGRASPRTLVVWVVAALVTVSGLPLATVVAPSASAAAATATASAVAADAPPTNDIQAENLLPGNPESEWQVSGSGDPSIQGYTTDVSADRGGSVSFKVDLDATVPEFHIDIYRLGWYGGDGARKVATIPASQTTSTDQPSCLDDLTGLIDCGSWSVSATWAVPGRRGVGHLHRSPRPR